MKDKVIVWSDADLTHFGIIHSLQNVYDCDFFAIFDVADKPKRFFQNQQLIHFKKTWFYHDHVIKSKEKPDLTYLTAFEEKYNLNLWLMAYNERIFFLYNEYHKFNEDEILKILEQECKLFENILDETKPDFVIMRASDLHQNQLFYELCKAKNIEILMLGQTRFAKRQIISSLWHQIDKKYDTNTQGQDRTIGELQIYLKGSDTFKQATNYTNRFQNSSIRKFIAAYKFLMSSNTNQLTHYTYFGRTKLRVLLTSIKFVLKKKYRQNFLNHNLVKSVKDDRPFLYFPLHLDQESTLLIGAPFYTNQLEVITHIVKSLPIGYRLYVKEHPAQSIRGWRKISFYKQIMTLPNVKLLHPSVKPDQILEKCSAVVSITSTAGLESAFYGKPSIIFAEAPYEMLPSVSRIKSIEELPKIIRDSLKKKINTSDLNQYVNFVNNNSFLFDTIAIELGYHRHFYHDGNLVDVEITESQMKSFLTEFNKEFNQLATEHLKKILACKEKRTE